MHACVGRTLQKSRDHQVQHRRSLDKALSSGARRRSTATDVAAAAAAAAHSHDCDDHGLVPKCGLLLLFSSIGG
jgi:hypothetical protein